MPILNPGDPGYDGDGSDPEYVPDPPVVTYPPYIATSALPNGSLNVAYNSTIEVLEGTTPYAFAIIAGALPAGIALNAATGVLSGTPTATGSFTFIVQVTDAAANTVSASFTLLIPSVPSIVNSSLPGGTVGTPYAASLSGQGGAQPYGFQVLSGGLPGGLTLASTGGITGIPTEAGTFTVTIQIYDSNDPQGTGSSIFVIIIAAASILDPVTTLDEMVLLGCADGGLYAIVPGQRYDTDIDGNHIGFLQQWDGVPAPNPTLPIMQLGGASLSAKGNGLLNAWATNSEGVKIPLTTATRTMKLSSTETPRDLAKFPAPQSERFGVGFNNGGVAGAWFEMHTAVLWVRKLFSSRKA